MGIVTQRRFPEMLCCRTGNETEGLDLKEPRAVTVILSVRIHE